MNAHVGLPRQILSTRLPTRWGVFQTLGFDTVDANQALGFDADCRDFALPAAILQYLEVGRVRLLTNNPRKVRALRDAGVGTD